MKRVQLLLLLLQMLVHGLCMRVMQQLVLCMQGDLLVLVLVLQLRVLRGGIKHLRVSALLWVLQVLVLLQRLLLLHLLLVMKELLLLLVLQVMRVVRMAGVAPHLLRKVM